MQSSIRLQVKSVQGGTRPEIDFGIDSLLFVLHLGGREISGVGIGLWNSFEVIMQSKLSFPNKEDRCSMGVNGMDGLTQCSKVFIMTYAEQVLLNRKYIKTVGQGSAFVQCDFEIIGSMVS